MTKWMNFQSGLVFVQDLKKYKVDKPTSPVYIIYLLYVFNIFLIYRSWYIKVA